jgi:hypothetical protein
MKRFFALGLVVVLSTWASLMASLLGPRPSDCLERAGRD